MTGLPSFYSAGIGTSRNGRYLVSGSSDISGGGDFYLVDLRTNTTLFNGNLNSRYTHVTLDVSDTGTRTLVSNVWVRDNTATNVCDLPVNDVARLNSAGTKAYAYLHANGGGGRIAVYNTTTAATTCAEIAAESVPVPDDMGVPTGVRSHDPNFAMTLVEDQKKVFLAGPSRIVVLAIQ